MIGRDAIHVLGLFGDSAEEVSAADDDTDLDSEAMHIGDLSRDLVHASVVDAKAFVGRESFAGKLEQDALVDRFRHRFVDSVHKVFGADAGATGELQGQDGQRTEEAVRE